MEKDRKGGRIGCEDDDLGDSSIQGLRGLVGTLLQLAVVRGLLDDVEDFLGESYGKSNQYCSSFANTPAYLHLQLAKLRIRFVLLPF